MNGVRVVVVTNMLILCRRAALSHIPKAVCTSDGHVLADLGTVVINVTRTLMG